MSRDPIGEYLREKLPSTEPTADESPPVRRISVPKIAGWCLLPILVLTAAWLLPGLLPGGQSGTTQAGRPAGSDRLSPVNRGDREVATIVLVTSGVELVGDGTAATPTAGDPWDTSRRIRTGPDGYVGLEMRSGASMVLGPESLLAARADGGEAVVLALHSGILSIRQHGDHGSPLTVESENARISSRAASLTVEAADGRIQRVSVHQGRAMVTRLSDGHHMDVDGSWSLDATDWSVDPDMTDPDMQDRLDALLALTTGIVEDVPAPAGPAVRNHHEPDAPEPPSLAQRIRDALDEGDVARAVEMVENEGKGHTEPAFLLAAAEAYKQGSQWSQAAQAYESVSTQSTGKEAERALIRAAEIRLRKLGDPQAAMDLVDDYFMRFPQGAYLDEATYLAAVIQARMGNHVKARTWYETYLGQFPHGAQAIRAHVALAQILAIALSDCDGALAHVQAVQGKAKGTALNAEIAKVQKACGQLDVEKP